MARKEYPMNNNGEIDEVGAPFEGFATEKYPYHSDTRIMPTQFNFPNLPMNYMVIRDITNDDDHDLKD